MVPASLFLAENHVGLSPVFCDKFPSIEIQNDPLPINQESPKVLLLHQSIQNQLFGLWKVGWHVVVRAIF